MWKTGRMDDLKGKIKTAFLYITFYNVCLQSLQGKMTPILNLV